MLAGDLTDTEEETAENGERIIEEDLGMTEGKVVTGGTEGIAKAGVILAEEVLDIIEGNLNL